MLNKIEFPVFKFRSFREIEYKPLGQIVVHTISGSFIVDDISIEGTTLAQRRLKIRDKKYQFAEKVDTLRHLSKFPTGTYFIDFLGKIFKYQKGRKRYKVESRKITRKREVEQGTIVIIKDIPSPELITNPETAEKAKYASIMFTDEGPFLYKYTEEPHKMYRRAI